MNGNCIPPSATLIDAVSAIESTTKRLAVVLSKDNYVLGTLTDGDIRRHLLRGNNLEVCVKDVMNTSPITASVNSSDSFLQKILITNNIRSIPLIDKKMKYIRTLHEVELDVDNLTISYEKNFDLAVIMAGGEGKRLMPLTENLPKPMIDINGIPVLETQIRSLYNMGIKKIYISVNYLNEVIKNYFGDGKKLGVEIFYLQESKKLGTAGALSLLPHLDKKQSILVINGDILTTSNFVNLFHFHQEQESSITIGAIDYHIEIPYGVIEFNNARVESIKEKPSQHFFCNAGIYAVSNKLLSKIPSNVFFNMTDLIESCLREGDEVHVFPVHEYWSDIGTIEDLDKAREDFKGLNND
jgi:dTDP-glucose pyrophosphorylase